MARFDLAKLESEFSRVAALPTPEAREAYLEQLTAVDAELAAEIRKLFASELVANKFFEAPHDQRLRMLMTTLGNMSGDLENEVESFLQQALPPQQPNELARLSNHFALHELVAVGSTGFLFRGYDCRLNRPVAIKALAPSVSRDPQRQSAFIDEARLASRIKHPNVVTIYHIEPGTPERPSAFLAMEWIDGRSLQQWLDQDSRSLQANASHLIAQMTAGIAAIHAQGIVHRDIKPGNLLFEQHTGRLVIVDFGLAFESGASEALFLPAGTPLYMSPEQVMGHQPTDHSDQFSTAVVAFQALTGQHPFLGQSVAELLDHIKHGKINCESKVLKSNQGALQVFRKAFAPLPADRFDNVKEFYDKLRQFVKTLPALTSGTAASATLSEALERSRPGRSPGRMTRTVAIGSLTLMVAVGLAYLSYLALNGTRLAVEPAAEMTAESENPSVEKARLPGVSVGLDDDASENQGWRWLDERTMVNRFGIEFTKVPPPSDSIVGGVRAEFPQHPEYTEGIDWRNWNKSFLISNSPITFRQYLAVMKQPPQTIQVKKIPYQLDEPVTHIMYREMKQFCDRLTEIEGIEKTRGYAIAELQQWSFAAYGDAMLAAPDEAEQIESHLLAQVGSSPTNREDKTSEGQGDTLIPNTKWASKLHLRQPLGQYWELTNTQKPTLQELDGVVSLHDWGRRRNSEEFVLVGRPTEDLRLHWFSLHNGCNNHFVSMENLMPHTETDGETSYLHPIEFGKPGVVTYRYQTDDPIVKAEVQSGLFIYHVGDEGGIRIRGRRSDRDPPLSEQAWVEAIKAEGVYDKLIAIDITDIVRGMREFEIQYWIVNHTAPRHYAQIFRGVLWKRDSRQPNSFVSLITQRPQASLRATGPVPEHFPDRRITFRIARILPHTDAE